MYKTVGERLSYCRNLLGVSRQEFVKKIGKLSVPTLSRWELNYNDIPGIKLDKLVNFFHNNGIQVSSEWILFNSGQPPINTNIQSFDKLNFDEISYITLSNLKTNVENFEIHQVNNNFFEPIIYNGDYVGGIFTKNLETLTNKLCYVLTNKMLYVGVFNHAQMSIVNFYKQAIELENITKIGSVSCISKRP